MEPLIAIMHATELIRKNRNIFDLIQSIEKFFYFS